MLQSIGLRTNRIDPPRRPKSKYFVDNDRPATTPPSVQTIAPQPTPTSTSATTAGSTAFLKLPLWSSPGQDPSSSSHGYPSVSPYFTKTNSNRSLVFTENTPVSFKQRLTTPPLVVSGWRGGRARKERGGMTMEGSGGRSWFNKHERQFSQKNELGNDNDNDNGDGDESFAPPLSIKKTRRNRQACETSSDIGVTTTMNYSSTPLEGFPRLAITTPVGSSSSSSSNNASGGGLRCSDRQQTTGFTTQEQRMLQLKGKVSSPPSLPSPPLSPQWRPEEQQQEQGQKQGQIVLSNSSSTSYHQSHRASLTLSFGDNDSYYYYGNDGSATLQSTQTHRSTTAASQHADESQRSGSPQPPRRRRSKLGRHGAVRKSRVLSKVRNSFHSMTMTKDENSTIASSSSRSGSAATATDAASSLSRTLLHTRSRSGTSLVRRLSGKGGHHSSEKTRSKSFEVGTLYSGGGRSDHNDDVEGRDNHSRSPFRLLANKPDSQSGRSEYYEVVPSFPDAGKPPSVAFTSASAVAPESGSAPSAVTASSSSPLRHSLAPTPPGISYDLPRSAPQRTIGPGSLASALSSVASPSSELGSGTGPASLGKTCGGDKREMKKSTPRDTIGNEGSVPSAAPFLSLSVRREFEHVERTAERSIWVSVDLEAQAGSGVVSRTGPDSHIARFSNSPEPLAQRQGQKKQERLDIVSGLDVIVVLDDSTSTSQGCLVKSCELIVNLAANLLTKSEDRLAVFCTGAANSGAVPSPYDNGNYEGDGDGVVGEDTNLQNRNKEDGGGRNVDVTAHLTPDDQGLPSAGWNIAAHRQLYPLKTPNMRELRANLDKLRRMRSRIAVDVVSAGVMSAGQTLCNTVRFVQTVVEPALRRDAGVLLLVLTTNVEGIEDLARSRTTTPTYVISPAVVPLRASENEFCPVSYSPPSNSSLLLPSSPSSSPSPLPGRQHFTTVNVDTIQDVEERLKVIVQSSRTKRQYHSEIKDISIRLQPGKHCRIEAVSRPLTCPLLKAGEMVNVLVLVRVGRLPKRACSPGNLADITHLGDITHGLFTLEDAFMDLEALLGDTNLPLLSVEVSYKHAMFPANTRISLCETVDIRRPDETAPWRSRDDITNSHESMQASAELHRNLTFFIATTHPPRMALIELERVFGTHGEKCFAHRFLSEAREELVHHLTLMLPPGIFPNTPPREPFNWTEDDFDDANGTDDDISPSTPVPNREQAHAMEFCPMPLSVRASSGSPATVIHRRVIVQSDEGEDDYEVAAQDIEVDQSRDQARQIWRLMRRDSRSHKQAPPVSATSDEVLVLGNNHGLARAGLIDEQMREIQRRALQNKRSVGADTLRSLAMTVTRGADAAPWL